MNQTVFKGHQRRNKRQLNRKLGVGNMFQTSSLGPVWGLKDRLDKHYKNAHKTNASAAKVRYRIQMSITDGGKVVGQLPQHLFNMHKTQKKPKRS